MANDRAQSNWSKSYWAILVNQTIVVGVVAFVAMGMLHESYQASKAAELYPPPLTQWYFMIGPLGVAAAALVFLGFSIAVIGLRRRIAASIVASASFVVCVVFLAGATLAAIWPLLLAIRDWLPLEERW